MPQVEATNDAVNVDTSTESSVESQETLQTQGDAGQDGVEPSSQEQTALEEKIDNSDLSDEQKVELKKKFNLKVYGEEVEEELDWSDEEAVKRHLSKSKAFDKTAQENSQLKQQVGAFFEQFKKDPLSVMQEMGMDVDEFVAARAQATLEEAEKTPEQKAQEEKDAKLAALEKELEDRKKNEEKLRVEQEKTKIMTKIDTDIRTALDASDSILPKKPEVLQRIAAHMMYAMKNGRTDIEVKDVIPMVEKQYRQEYAALASSLSEDKLEEFIGSDNLDRVRKKKLASKQKPASASGIKNDVGKKVEQEKKKPVSYKDLFSLRKR
jgi:hypothetical protein